MRYFIGGVLVVGAIIGIDWLLAQEVVWGLSLFHVNSGIWGPWLLLSAVAGTFTVAASISRAFGKD